MDELEDRDFDKEYDQEIAKMYAFRLALLYYARMFPNDTFEREDNDEQQKVYEEFREIWRSAHELPDTATEFDLTEKLGVVFPEPNELVTLRIENIKQYTNDQLYFDIHVEDISDPYFGPLGQHPFGVELTEEQAKMFIGEIAKGRNNETLEH